jgi:actin-related protein 3
MSDNLAVVIDNGTGYTKMGFAGNPEPHYIIPTAIATGEGGSGSKKDPVDDLDFYIGYEAQQRAGSYSLNYPIAHGLIDNWDNMEKLWQRCLFKYLKCEPQDHYVMLTEPPMNPPENRELAAEIMFETFNVPGLYMAVQAVLSLTAAWTTLHYSKAELSVSDLKKRLTGTVIDSGDGVTHIVPVAEGYVVGTSIRHIPVAGRDVSEFVQGMLKDRHEPIPPEDLKLVAQKIKEKFCYTCKDVVKEFQKYDADPSKFEEFSGVQARTKKPWTCKVGYERFLGPEVFFTPEIFRPEFPTPLSQVVDEVIVSCPIDCRRDLYNNIVLSGGSTMFKDFGKRLQRDIKRHVDARVKRNVKKMGITREEDMPRPIKVDVAGYTAKMQRYAVWLGGSIMAANPEFHKVCHTKADYDEHGPRIARFNAAFNATM